MVLVVPMFVVGGLMLVWPLLPSLFNRIQLRVCTNRLDPIRV